MTTPQANPHGLMTIGAVAAHNIVALLNLDPKHVGTVEQAIKDEINALSSHFTLAVADVATQHEVAEAAAKKDMEDFVAATKAREVAAVAAFNAKVGEIKSTYSFLDANKGKIVGVVFAAYIAGGLSYALFG